MPEDGSPRPRLIRRTLVAIARAAGLFILIVGINGVLGIAAPRLLELPRYVISLVAGVAIFESLRPGRRRAPAPAPVGTSAELAEVNAALRSEIERLRDDSLEREAALRQESEELADSNRTLQGQIVSLSDELGRHRDAAVEAVAREAQLREQFEAESQHLQGAAGRALEEVQSLRTAVDELRGQAERERQRGDEAVRDLEQMRNASAKEIETQRAESERERQRAEQSIRDHEQAPNAAAKEVEAQRAETQRERQRADQAIRELEQARGAAESQRASAVQEADKLRADGQRERQRADQAVRELQNAISSAAAVATQRQKLESQLADFDRRLAAAMQELDALRAERQRTRREIEETRQRAEVEKGDLRRSQQELVNKLTSERETTLGAILEERDTARSEAQSLQTALQDERQRAAETAALRKALEEEIASLRASAVDEKALREAIDVDWNAKLQKIVNELATDHEADIGEAIAAREEVRAELRSLTARVRELQDQLEDARNGRLGLLQRDDERMAELARLQQENAELRSRPAPVDETALRELIEAEWSAKLQTIVSHMATDHEADVGKAIEEREAARAEARNLAMKITSLQTKLRQAEQEIASLRSAPPPPPPAPPPPMPEPVAVDAEELRARAEVLQFAEQARDAIRRATSPGDVPLPPPERRARILFVHHDPAMRSMWRDNLDQSGFDVQTAADGLEGLRLTMAGRPDVVIADASMPKMGGRELCQLIKSNQETAGVKVILMTGVYTNEVPMESASHEFEADEMLRKPVKFETLKAALSNLLAAV